MGILYAAVCRDTLTEDAEAVMADRSRPTWRRLYAITQLPQWRFKMAAAFLMVAVVASCAPMPAHAERLVRPSPLAAQYRATITREAQMRFGIPAPVPVIAAQIQQESAWRPDATSRVGALGLMQFMPATAAWASTQNAWGTMRPLDAHWSIRAGVWYDRWLYDRVRTSASECDRWHFTLSAYNGGLGWVYKRQAMSAAPGFWDQTGSINPGIHPANQQENARYSPRILLGHQPGFAGWGRSVCLEGRP